MPGAYLLSDVATMLDTAEFASAAVFDGDTASVNGILDKDYDLSEFGQIGSYAPVFALASADVPANAHQRYLRFGNLLTGGTRYRVMGVHADGTGVTVLILQEA